MCSNLLVLVAVLLLLGVSTCVEHDKILDACCEKTAASNVPSSRTWDGLSYSTEVHPP